MLRVPVERSARILLPTLVTAVVVAAGLLGEIRPATADEVPTNAVGRLIVDAKQLCTAFVIRSIERRSTVPFGIPRVTYENWIVTAAHCFGQHLVFQHNGTRYPAARVVAFSTGESLGYDLMVATFPTPVPVPTLDLAFGVYPPVGNPLMLIGYGGRALMTRVDPLLSYDARGFMKINGYASPGASGGPVLIPGTRSVVGIGIESTINRPAGTPSLFCVLTKCGVQPPYVAVHIDKLRGLAIFP